MTRKLFFMLFLFGIFANGVYGQDSLAYKSKWQTKILVGMNIPITKPQTEIDYLFQYDDYSFYIQPPLAISCFFHKHWGLEANFQVGYSSGIGKRGDKFVAAMQSEYGDKYYVRAGADGPSFSFFRGYAGIIYRLETNKFYVYPKFSIGVLVFDTELKNVGLKEKNSNYEYTIWYSSTNKTDYHSYFTLASSASFGYKIVKRLYLNADIMLSYFKTNTVFEKEVTNLYTKEKTAEYFDYKKNIFTLSLSAGLIYVIY